MVNENVSGTGSRPTHGKGGKAGPIVFISLALILAAGGGGYLWVRHFRQTDDNAESSGKNGEVGEKEKVIDPRDRFEKEQERQLLRAGLEELVEEGNSVRQDIDALEQDIDAYERQLKEIVESDAGKQAVKNVEAIRYFFDNGGEVLPSKAVARALRARVDELMFAAEEALLKPKEAFAVSEEMREQVVSIGRQVREARREYTHRRLMLDGLMKGATAGQNGKPEAIEGTMPGRLDRSRLKDLLEEADAKKDAGHTVEETAEEDSGGATEPRSPTGD